MSSVSEPGQGNRRMPQTRNGCRGLQPDRSRRRQRQQGIGKDRQDPRQDRRAGLSPLARSTGDRCIPRTSRVERLKENFMLFDFDLTDAEMREIASLARGGERIVDWTWSPNWD